MKQTEITIKDFTKDGKCSNCGECCSNILPMSRKDIKRIKAYVKQHNIKEQRHNALVGIDMTCPFRDEANRKCLIYEIRPAICRCFMCNHTTEDIQKSKIDLHEMYEPVFMRATFFGNTEDVEFMAGFGELMRGVMN